MSRGRKKLWEGSSGLAPMFGVLGVSIALAALHYRVLGGLDGWAYVYVIGAIVLGFVVAGRLGQRQTPSWFQIAAIGGVIGGGVLLEISEYLSLLLLLGWAAFFAWLRRQPHYVAPTPRFEGGTVVPVSDPVSFGEPDPTVAPEDGSVTIPLLSRTRALGGLAVVVAVAALGGYAVYAAVAAPEQFVSAPEDARVVRILGGAFGSFMLLVGLVLAAGMVRVVAHGARLEVDAVSLRSRGSLSYDITWADIERVGLRVRIREIPGRVAARRKRDIWLVFDPVGESLANRDEVHGIAARLATSPAPAEFTEQLRVADAYYQEPSPVVVALDDALARFAPGRYVGVIRD